MNKQLFLTFFCAIGLTALMAHGSNSTAMSTLGSVAAKDNTAALPPMFLMGSNNGKGLMVYWEDWNEPVKNEDNADFFDKIHQEWALQELFRRNASQYTKLIVNGTITCNVKYVDEVLLNPDGEPMYFGELHSRPEIPSPGARYSLQSGEPLSEDEHGGVLVTDSYLAMHKPMAIRSASEDELLPLPANVIKEMEDTYGMKVEKSAQSYIIGDRYIYGVLQFQGEYKNSKKKKHEPDEKSALALEIIIDGGNIYAYPVEGYFFPDEGPTWNADDGGEYFPSHIAAAFEGPQGPEFCFIHWAPESATTGLFYIRGGKLDRQQYAVYHSLIDEPIPVWKKDIEEMKRLYVADDPGENKHVELTKWAHVYIDYDGEQLWISDEEEENGAFFTREDGKFNLIGTVRANLKPSFPESMNGNHYLVLSGPAGGPAYYTEIYRLQDGKVVEKFNAMEVYGEIDECHLNGKTISAEEGKAYMKAIPEATEPFIFWEEISNKE